MNRRKFLVNFGLAAPVAAAGVALPAAAAKPESKEGGYYMRPEDIQKIADAVWDSQLTVGTAEINCDATSVKSLTNYIG